MIVTVYDKITNYKPIVATGSNYTINFECVEEFSKEVKIINGKSKDTGKTVSTGFAHWKTFNFDHKPSTAEIKTTITEYYNSLVVRAITAGFVWHGMNVDLTSENQANYKSEYDLAMQTGAMNLPVKFKFKQDGKVVYHTFNTLDELTEFYIAIRKHINSCLECGWKHKDTINWADYTI